MKIFIIAMALVVFACNASKDITPPSKIKNSIGWSRQADLPGHLRIGTGVVSESNDAYLMPGRGGYRYGTETEILKYTNNEWSEIANYGGWAKAGGSGTWQNGDLIYIVGGINGSGAPTDEVVSYSISNNTFSEETPVPTGRRGALCSCNTLAKGYIGYGLSYTPSLKFEEDIWSYHFDSKVWEPVPKRPNDQVVNFSLMVCRNNSVYLLLPTLTEDNFYVFREKTSTWTGLADFPGDTRLHSVIVSNGTHIYTGLGTADTPNGAIYDDLWKYDIEKNKWVEHGQYPGTPFHSGFAFELNGDLFFGGGSKDVVISSGSLNKELFRLRTDDHH